MNGVDVDKMNRHNFRACLQALSRPGNREQIVALSDGPLQALAFCLLSSEVTSCFRGDRNYMQVAALTGSEQVAASRADYIFCEMPDTASLAAAKTGSLLHPDHSATLFVQSEPQGSNKTQVCLRGPGINKKTMAFLPVPQDFLLLLQKKNKSFPLGVDCFFIGQNNSLTGVARTTRMELIQ